MPRGVAKQIKDVGKAKRCHKDLEKQGKSKSEAIAICNDSLRGKTNRKKK